MAHEKDDRSGAPIRKPEPGDEKRMHGTAPRQGPKEGFGPREAVNGGVNGGGAPAASATRSAQYLIGARSSAALQPSATPQRSMDAVVEYLGKLQNAQIVRRIKSSRPQRTVNNGSASAEVLVVRIEESIAESIRATAPPDIIIERDSFLADASMTPAYQIVTGGMLPLRSVGTEISIRIVGERDQPLPKATVVVYGAGFPTQALTDDAGAARLTLFGGLADAVQAVYVKPTANYWERFITRPRLDDSGVNTFRLRPLAQTLPNFPTERTVGWGQRVMGLDHPGGDMTGTGVRIGIIDSGCDNSHPQLRHVTHGLDFVTGDSEAWTDDVLSHGTHCCGIVSAANTGQGILGFAPGAEVHAFKVVPGGRMSDLIAALDECMARDLDVVSISVSSLSASELVSRKLLEARQKGVACIVAAGDAGGPVRFPAMLPGVMAVGAVGKLREFPQDSYHARNVIPQLLGREDLFAARFSCFGSQIAVSGPGVAIVSTVPGGGYAAADGTSAAAAHIAGFAGLLLAHHPLFGGLVKVPVEQRVDVLFGLIRASAMPQFGDPLRGGAGVPGLQYVATQSVAAGFTVGTPDPLGNVFAFETMQQAAPAWSSSGPFPAANGWHTLMQMRAAGLF